MNLDKKPFLYLNYFDKIYFQNENLFDMNFHYLQTHRFGKIDYQNRNWFGINQYN